MPPESVEPGTPADWLRYAHSDLELAKSTPSPRVLLEGLCFHAQQAAEKALKAVLLSLGVAISRTHNIGALLDLLPSDTELPIEIDEATILTDYAVLSRYPGTMEEVTDAEYQEALRLASAWLFGPKGFF